MDFVTDTKIYLHAEIAEGNVDFVQTFPLHGSAFRKHILYIMKIRV